MAEGSGGSAARSLRHEATCEACGCQVIVLNSDPHGCICLLRSHVRPLRTPTWQNLPVAFACILCTHARMHLPVALEHAACLPLSLLPHATRHSTAKICKRLLFGTMVHLTADDALMYCCNDVLMYCFLMKCRAALLMSVSMLQCCNCFLQCCIELLLPDAMLYVCSAS